MGQWDPVREARGCLPKADFVTSLWLKIEAVERGANTAPQQTPPTTVSGGSGGSQWCPPQAPIVFLHAPGPQQLACHVASPGYHVLMCTMPAGFTAEPKRDNPGQSGGLCDLGQIPSQAQCPTCKMKGTRCSLRVLHASHARAPF